MSSQNPKAACISNRVFATLAVSFSCLLVLSWAQTAPAQESPPPTGPVDVEVSNAGSAGPTQPDSSLRQGQLQFNFRHAPWEDVLEWLAGEAGLSFSADVVPTGTFNYLDDEQMFNTEEAIDLVNSYLLIKGYTLVRKGKMLLVIDLEEEIDAQLVRDLLTETPQSELDKRGDYEITKTRFLLDKVDAAEAEKQINQLLSPVGSIVVMPKAKQLMVTETGGTLRMIRGILESLEATAAAEETGKLHMFPLQIASADEVLMVARPLLGIEEDGSAPEDKSIRISADPLGRTVFATGTAEQIKLVEQIVESVDARAGASSASSPTEAPQFMSYSVSATSADAVLRVLQTLFVGDPAIRLEVDQSTGGIIAYATVSQHRTIKATIAEMERNPEKVEVLSLNGTDPTVAAALIEKLFSGVEKPPVVDGTFDPPQLVVRGTQPQIQQIRELLNEVGDTGQTRTSSVLERGNLRLVPMDSETARAVAERIKGIWPNLRQNPIRVVVPSRSSALQTERPDPSLLEAPSRPGGRMSRGVRRPGGGEMNRPRRLEGGRRPAQPEGLRPEAERAPVDRPVRTTLDEPAASSLLPVSYQGPADSDQPPQTAALAEPATEDPSAGDDEPPAEDAPEDDVPADQPSSPSDPASPAEDRIEADDDTIPPEIIISPTAQGLMITSDDPDALDTIQSLVEMFASQESSSQPQFHLFYLKHVEAETARTLITSIMTGVTGTDIASMTVGSAASSGDSSGRGGLSQGRPTTSATSTSFSTLPHIVADKRLNALFVNGTLEQITLVKQLLEVVDTESGPEEVLTFPRPKFIPVYHTKAETVADVLRELYANRVETATQNNRGQQNSRDGRSFPPGFAERFGRGGGRGGDDRQARGGQQSAAGELPKMSIGVDIESNAVIVSAQGPLLKEVEAVIEELDHRAMNKPPENIAVVTLKRTSPQLVREAIANILGDQVEVTQSSSGSSSQSSRTSSNRSGTSTGRGGFPGFGAPGGFTPPWMQGRGSGGGRGGDTTGRGRGGGQTGGRGGGQTGGRGSR